MADLATMCVLLMQEAAQALGLPSHMDPKGDIAPELLAQEDHFGCPSGEPDQWGSCVRLVQVAQNGLSTSSVLHLDKNEAALCMCLVAFDTHGAGQQMLAVGTAKDLRFYPRRATGGHHPSLFYSRLPCIKQHALY